MDKRRFPRASYKCSVSLKQKGETAVLQTVTENLGLGGVCVLLDKGLDIFSPVSLEIKLDEAQPPVSVLGTIVWVVRRREFKKGSSFDTGIEFSELSPPNRSKIEAVLAKLAAAA
jgi:c-di-GMP-binding flagellar brake protein YcgR